MGCTDLVCMERRGNVVYLKCGLLKEAILNSAILHFLVCFFLKSILNWIHEPFYRSTKQHCVDAHVKSCYEILRQLTAHKNLILCKKCGTKENQIVDFQIDDNPPIKLVLPDPAQTIELLEKR